MEFRLHDRDGIRWLTSPLLDRFGTLSHGYGVRSSDGGPGPSPVQLLGAIGRTDTEPLTLRQVHGNAVFLADTRPAPPPEADAAQTSVPFLAPTIQTADCVSILLWCQGGSTVSAVHAGWRGLQSGIVAAAVQSLLEASAGGAEQVVAAVGPSIGPCCFEVGEEVAAQFDPKFRRPGLSDRPYLDLWAIARQRLLDESVLPQHIDVAQLCTACRPDLFPSYRRDDGTNERSFSVIALRSKPAGA